MTKKDRLALLAVHAAVLAMLAGTRVVPAALGAIAGLVAGLALNGRLRGISLRMDERLGAEVETHSAFAPRRVAVRAGGLLATIAALFVFTAFVPLLGVTLFVGSAAATTGAVAALNATRLRR